MSGIRADQKNYKNAFKKHIHTFNNGKECSDISQRLILCYCVECGLKCLIMQNNKILRTSQANSETASVLGSHDIRVLLKAVKMAGRYQFKNFQTEYGETVTAESYHQLCRYCIRPKNGEMFPIKEFDKMLAEIAEWLNEVI